MKGGFILLVIITIFAVSLNAQPRERGKTERTAPAALVIPDADLATPVTLSHYLSARTGATKEFIRELYNWIVWNIGYDVENMYNPGYYKDTLDAAMKTLKTRVGVCQGYANLYYLVCREAGIPVQLIAGYTKTNGQIDNASHAWVAVQIDSAWYMTDPTWGAGVVINNRFVRKPVDSYFLVSPETFIVTHMPFDPLWQLLEHPVRHDEFRNNDVKTASTRPVFNYADSLAAYNLMKDDLLKYQQVIGRIDRLGVANQMVGDELAYYRKLVSYIAESRQIAAANKAIDGFNWSSGRYNRAVSQFNEYVRLRNNQFRSVKTDAMLRDMLNVVGKGLTESRRGLAGLSREDVNLRANIVELEASLRVLEKRLAEEQAFVERYIRTEKTRRSALFYKENGKFH